MKRTHMLTANTGGDDHRGFKGFLAAILFTVLTAFALAALSGCSASKKTIQSHTVAKDSSAHVVTNTQETIKSIKDIDTNILIPAANLAGIVPQPLAPGDTCILEDSTQTIQIASAPDKNGKKQLWLKSTTKPKFVPVKLHEETATTRTITAKADVKTVAVAKDYSKKKFSIGVPWYAYVIGAVFIALMILLGVWKAKKQVVAAGVENIWDRLK